MSRAGTDDANDPRLILTVREVGYRLAIDTGVVTISAASLSALLNDYVFNYDGSPLDNLTVTVPVTYPEAALGGDIDVPTLDGTSVTLRLRPGTQTGSRHRVKGKGIETKHHTGDLIVTVNVQVQGDQGLLINQAVLVRIE